MAYDWDSSLLGVTRAQKNIDAISWRWRSTDLSTASRPDAKGAAGIESFHYAKLSQHANLHSEVYWLESKISKFHNATYRESLKKRSYITWSTASSSKKKGEAKNKTFMWFLRVFSSACIQYVDSPHWQGEKKISISSIIRCKSYQ